MQADYEQSTLFNGMGMFIYLFIYLFIYFIIIIFLENSTDFVFQKFQEEN